MLIGNPALLGASRPAAALVASRCAPPLLSLADYVSAAGVYRLRDQAVEQFTSAVNSPLQLPTELPHLPDLDIIKTDIVNINIVSGELLDLLMGVSDQVISTGDELLFASATLALLTGLIFGDRSEPSAVYQGIKDADVFRTELSPQASEAWDRGETDLKAIGTSKNSRFARAQAADEAMARSTIFSESSRILARPVSFGTWVELVFCVLIDLAGNASLSIPGYGELTDFIGASVIAFLVNLIFEWPALAAIAFWEEVLPFTDIIPTCTLGWTAVLLGIRPWINARVGVPPRVDEAPPPVGDLQSYGEVEEWLQPESRPWE